MIKSFSYSILIVTLVCGFRYEDEYQNIFRTSNVIQSPPKFAKTDHGLLNIDEMPKIFDGKNGSIHYKNNSLVFNCYGRFLITDVFSPIKEVVVNHIAIEDCTLPVKPLVQLFEELNINTTYIKSLKLAANLFPHFFDYFKTKRRDFDVLPEGNYTEGLNIEELWINRYSSVPHFNFFNFFDNNTKFMMPLTNLKKLTLTGVQLPALPPEMKLNSLSLYDVLMPTWDDYFRNIEALRIVNVYEVGIPSEWPKNSSQLKFLTLGSMKEVTSTKIIRSGINASCTDLETLLIWSCNLTTLPLEIMNVAATSLKALVLQQNRLTDIELSDFPMMPNLTGLDLSNNRLTGWSLFNLVKQVPALLTLELGGNNFLNLFCNFETRINIFTSNLKSLRNLWLDEMPMNVNCLKNAHFASLSYINLAGTGDIDVLEFQNLPRTNSPTLLVDLRYRSIKTIAFGSVDYYYFAKGESATEGYENSQQGIGVVVNLGFDGPNKIESAVIPKVSKYWRSNYNSERTRLTVLLSPVDCDCNNYWLALGLRNLKNVVSLPDLRCKNTGVEIIKEPLKNLYCEKFNKLGCIQRRTKILDTDDNFKIPQEETLECHNHESENDEYPIYKSVFNITSLNLTDNHMENLKKLKIFDTVKSIDLRKNRISHLDMNDTKRLFANSERRIWLSNNLIVCDCENAEMIDAFHEHRDQIVDFEDILCIDSNIPLSSVTSYEACQYGLKAALSSSAVLFVLILIAAILLWYYRLQIKMYLYSRGWCLFCLSEDDVDSDRPYDAFLSFSHGDERYVVEELLPKLESEPNFYKICVHYRDWAVGDWIPAQIMRSVRLSKRTMIVLSRNFVESLWGSLEFRYAIASSQQEGHSRLIVLILDDVLSLPLGEELKDYLHYNTYLRCDDPWFWEKLRYTMPRQKRSPEDKLTEQLVNPQAESDEMLMNDLMINSTNLTNSHN